MELTCTKMSMAYLLLSLVHILILYSHISQIEILINLTAYTVWCAGTIYFVYDLMLCPLLVIFVTLST